MNTWAVLGTIKVFVFGLYIYATSTIDLGERPELQLRPVMACSQVILIDLCNKSCTVILLALFCSAGSNVQVCSHWVRITRYISSSCAKSFAFLVHLNILLTFFFYYIL